MERMLKLQNMNTGNMRYYPVDNDTLVEVGETIRLFENSREQRQIYKILSITFVEPKPLPRYKPDEKAFNDFIEYSLADVGKKLTYENYKKFKKEKK